MFTETKATDNTALERQNRRIQRLKKQGVTRSTVFVHQECKSLLDELRPHLVDPKRAETLSELVTQLEEKVRPTNVAQVNQLSPFRYPGGKTWLVPEIREWLKSIKSVPDVFVEPFAGGAIAGLTAAAEGLAYGVVLSELDEDVSAVWRAIFQGTDESVKWLCRQITSFDVTLENVRRILASEPKSDAARAFRTIIKNRVQRGGIMAPGAGLVKEGEGGRGLRSRWYPETLSARIRVLRALRDKVTFLPYDAFFAIEQFIANPKASFFIDPPYTAGGKKAGARLYSHNEVNHEKLFALMATARGNVMMTYDDTSEVRSLAARFGFRVRTVPMKNTHHEVIQELLILKP
jgi:DNA adenine methylase